IISPAELFLAGSASRRRGDDRSSSSSRSRRRAAGPVRPFLSTIPSSAALVPGGTATGCSHLRQRILLPPFSSSTAKLALNDGQVTRMDMADTLWNDGWAAPGRQAGQTNAVF